MKSLRPETGVRLMAAAVAAMLAAACGAPASGGAPATATPAVKVYRSRGALQCGTRGTAPEAMRQQLEQAGVRVLGQACGSDGRMRPAMCGAGTDEINLFDIAERDLARAVDLGFAPLARLPGEPRVVPCRP